MPVPSVPTSQTPWPVRSGNTVTPWVDGVAFYGRLLAAIRAAKTSVWGVLSFVHRDFAFPDGTLLWDAFDAAAARGVDVRLLCWRNTAFTLGHGPSKIFHGTADDLAFLARRDTQWRAKWDDSHPDRGHCHHQKLWVVDAGEPSEVGFVGGMTLGKSTVDGPKHLKPHSRHDVFFEVRGPASSDVAANFIQRWNHPRVAVDTPPPWPDDDGLLEATAVAPAVGTVPVQITRTIAPGRYGLEDGESGILAQHRRAFAAAERTIYIENQHPGEESLLVLLDEALTRGVEVVYLVPGEPMLAIRREKARTRGRYAETFRRLAALGRHSGFTLAALATATGEVYVHAKVCIVDGEWCTGGSANLVNLSLAADHTELNLSLWHAPTALGLLLQLGGEHTGADLSGEDDLGVLRAMSTAARHRRGHLYALDPAQHGDERAQRTEASAP
ncbi:MAG: cardiolipin synthase [Myxococcota bacterium]|jgi:cardiolipin synthase